jgi:hypothetical protein
MFRIMWYTAVLCLAVTGVIASGCDSGAKSSRHTTTSPRTGDDIATARRSGRLFEIFPARSAEVACDVPRGGPYSPGHMTLPGTCSTTVLYQGGPQATVVFVERWHEPGGTRWWKHKWLVRVSGGTSVVWTRSTGTGPPQLWK